ncbi:isoleucine--tRNA ligase [Microgenomates group bacterium]|nr:isoleucine--tRNA ligase [Microgenomates group bacterium]
MQKPDFRSPPDIAALEKTIIAYWERENIFAKTLQKTKDGKEYTFYDGPPFATGLPHYGHLLASTTKDLIPRYQTMKGKFVERKWGWDCHGLPIENLVEKELNLINRRAIEEYGVAKFNEQCRAKVMEYADEWQKIIRRFGRFVDMENDYKTMDKDFMDQVWGVFKRLWDKELIYHDYKAMHYCPRCGTPLSNFEVTQGYKDIKDISVTVEFALHEPLFDQQVSALAWTTTPWTLPANMLLAVAPDLDYLVVKGDIEGYFLVLKDLSSTVFGHDLAPEQIIGTLRGSDLVGLKYTPVFDFVSQQVTHDQVFTIQAADFIDTTTGTGIVHIAPGFGEDDYQLGKKLGLPLIQHVDDEGKFVPAMGDPWAGMEVKPRDNPQVTDIAILKYLKECRVLFNKQTITHSYPHCWRCDTPLLNYATNSWFLAVTKLKDALLKNNQLINWSPEHIKNGRFGKWLEGVRDWAISRNRYWGTPLPVWISETGKYLCIGSSAELAKLAGLESVDDLHKHKIDDIIIYHENETYHRTPEVLDCWFESGSMPYATHKSLPADFISEGQDQTRGWFYTLHVLATALENSPAFNNCICSGIILAADGKKMSKKLSNYPDPALLFEQYGVDSLRLYLMSSPVIKAESLNFNESEVADWRRRVLVIWWNLMGFYQGLSNITVKVEVDPTSLTPHLLDSWLSARLQQLTQEVTQSLDNYDLNRYVRLMSEFIDQFSTWYLRLSRDRLRQTDEAGLAARRCFGHSLRQLAVLMAPLTPFFADTMYLAQKDLDESSNDSWQQSVHLEDWPLAQKFDSQLLLLINGLANIVEQAHRARSERKIRVRQPLASITLKQIAVEMTNGWQEDVEELLKQELNVKSIIWSDKEALDFDWTLTPELENEGLARDLMRDIARERKKLRLSADQEFFYEVSSIPAGWQEQIETKTSTRLKII